MATIVITFVVSIKKSIMSTDCEAIKTTYQAAYAEAI
jgi:hypothetical protein